MEQTERPTERQTDACRRALPNAVLWVLLPLVVLGALELVARRLGSRHGHYRRVEAVAARGPVDAVFVGSSRTTACIDPEEFADVVEELTGERPVVARVGIGWSTNGQHLAGFRNVSEARPGWLRGATVFLETRGGVPGSDVGRALRGEHGPGAFEDVVRLRDVPRLVRERAPAEHVADGALAAATRPLRVVGMRRLFRRRLLQRGTALVGSLISGEGDDAGDPQIAEGGGIQTGAEEIETVRRALAGETVVVPRFEWGENGLFALVDHATEGGAEVVALELPLSARDARVAAEPDWAAAASAAEPLLRERGVVPLDTGLRYPASAFPDDLHLDTASAREFTRAVARAWVRARER